MDGIVDGGDDFGIDALYFEPPEDGEIHITLVQGKYKRDLGGQSAFPENGVSGMVAALGALFDPARPVQLNRRLSERIEDIRSFVKEGAIPRVTAVAANNGKRWTTQAQQRIDNAARDFGDQVGWRHIGDRKPMQDGSRFIAMLMGEYLLEGDGYCALSARPPQFRSRAGTGGARIRRLPESGGRTNRGQALGSLFTGRERTLQRLSATFRRADLVDTLLESVEA